MGTGRQARKIWMGGRRELFYREGGVIGWAAGDNIFDRGRQQWSYFVFKIGVYFLELLKDSISSFSKRFSIFVTYFLLFSRKFYQNL